MRVTVRVFGGLVEAAGRARLDVEVADGARVEDLLGAVSAGHPRLAPLLPTVNVAVDLEVVPRSTVLSDASEVALLPPVAGGAGDPRDGTRPIIVTGLQEPPFDIAATLSAVSAASVGGTATFVGTVRDHAPDLDDIVELEYSAYTEMAEKVLDDLARAVADDHPTVSGIALLHAVGRLPVGAQTVLIVCAAAHRQAAFDACRDALERVKAHLPIWKREITADGAHRWVGLTPSQPSTDSSRTP